MHGLRWRREVEERFEWGGFGRGRDEVCGVHTTQQTSEKRGMCGQIVHVQLQTDVTLGQPVDSVHRHTFMIIRGAGRKDGSDTSRVWPRSCWPNAARANGSAAGAADREACPVLRRIPSSGTTGDGPSMREKRNESEMNALMEQSAVSGLLQ